MKCYSLWFIIGLLGVCKCTHWDFLIFTQRWPITACSEWEEHSKNNTCVLPEPENLWTIHGIWPTIAGTKGPWNCNSSWHFDDNLINPIKLELEEYWTNIEGNTQLDSLWKHEWVKHGTCAAILPVLDNEFKYFNQGLKWIKQYNMRDILQRKQIFPHVQGYSIEDLFESVRSELGKIPIIQCIVDRYTKQSLISEIRICFDKDLNLIDCRLAKHFGDYELVGDILTNCNVNKTVVYPDSIDPYTTTTTIPSTTQSSYSLLGTREKLYNLYKSIKLIIWFTF